MDKELIEKIVEYVEGITEQLEMLNTVLTEISTKYLKMIMTKPFLIFISL